MAEQRRALRRAERDSVAMPSVLIIDDEPNIRRMVGALLGAEGYEVRDAQRWRDGLAARAARASPTCCCSTS